jgi:hypothetical protein
VLAVLAGATPSHVHIGALYLNIYTVYIITQLYTTPANAFVSYTWLFLVCFVNSIVDKMGLHNQSFCY